LLLSNDKVKGQMQKIVPDFDSNKIESLIKSDDLGVSLTTGVERIDGGKITYDF
jgi:hypothetical protein